MPIPMAIPTYPPVLIAVDAADWEAWVAVLVIGAGGGTEVGGGSGTWCGGGSLLYSQRVSSCPSLEASAYSREVATRRSNDNLLPSSTLRRLKLWYESTRLEACQRTVSYLSISVHSSIWLPGRNTDALGPPAAL